MSSRTSSLSNAAGQSPALSQLKRAKINRRKEQWRQVLAEGKENEKQSLPVARDHHRSDRHRRLEWNEHAEREHDFRLRRKEPRQVRREARAEVVQFTRRTLKMEVEEDAVDKLREKRLLEKHERDRARQEDQRRKLEMEMAAPPPIIVTPKPEPLQKPRARKRPRRSPPEKEVEEPSWLEALFSTFMTATSCCAGEECVGEEPHGMAPPE